MWTSYEHSLFCPDGADVSFSPMFKWDANNWASRIHSPKES
jgi:hypothetical protein